MDRIANFGKHIGETYDYILNNDKSYCIYVLSRQTCSGEFKDFRDFLFENLNEVYNTDELKNFNLINCTDLIEYMACDKNVLNIIKDFKVNIVDVEYINYNNNIFPKLYGEFIDYLIRYFICLYKKITFEDKSAEQLLRFGSSRHKLQSLTCDYLSRSVEYIENLDNNFINNLANLSNISISEITNIVNDYKNRCVFIKDSYFRLKNNNALFVDILNITIGHSLSQGSNQGELNYINYKNEIINEDSCNVIYNYIKQKVINKENILLNPNLRVKSLNITAFADLIIDNELIDFKVSKDKGLNINDFIQLIVYATLYYIRTDIVCYKLTIYNPLLGKETHIIINEEIIKQFVIIFQNYNIGFNLKE